MSIKIQCKICNKISDTEHLWSHLRKHNIEYEDYIKQNLDQFPHRQEKKCTNCQKKIYRNDICDECSLKHKGILCKICNTIIRSKKGLCFHLKTHNVSFSDYVKNNREQFPNWNDCRICGKLTKQKTCSRTCDKIYRKTLIGDKAPRYGAVLSLETIDKMKKTKRKRFEAGLHNTLKGDDNPACRPEVRKKISETCLRRGSNVGKKNGMYGKTHTPEAIKKIFSHRKMNKVEKSVADFLDKKRISYYFQFFINENGICKSYDFKIKRKPIIIEVDGDFWHGGPGVTKYWKDVEKVKANDILKEKMANDNGYEIIRFWQSELKKDINVISQYL